MKFVIEKELLSKVKCEYGFSCLESDQIACDHKVCSVSRANGENILFLKDSSYLSCPFLVHFGGGAICRCPVRYVIYKKYGH